MYIIIKFLMRGRLIKDEGWIRMVGDVRSAFGKGSVNILRRLGSGGVILFKKDGKGDIPLKRAPNMPHPQADELIMEEVYCG
jgi:hypothetical protein